MSEQLTQALKNLYDVLQQEAHDHCVSVNVFFNCEGYRIEQGTHTPESLKRAGVSMRNLRGEWVR